MGIYVVRAFVRLRGTLASDQELVRKIEALERRTHQKLASHDQAIVELLKTIRELMVPSERPKRPIGFEHPQHKKPSAIAGVDASMKDLTQYCSL